MKKIYFFLLLFTAASNAQMLFAQDSTLTFIPKTISVEEMIGHKRQFLQLVINKVFVAKKKIGLLSITSYAADYKDNLSSNEFQNTTLIYHHLFKGVSINSGVSFTSVEGLKNFLGLQYIYHTQSFSLIYLPGYYFIKSHKIANTALIEYKPAINKNWSIYSRLQLHYNRNLENNSHFRSYVYSRLGVTYKYFSFGLAHNFDRYGINQNTRNNYGIFLKLTQ